MTLEEFVNKEIAESLRREANRPEKLAGQSLLRAFVKLVRERANIRIEMGCDNYEATTKCFNELVKELGLEEVVPKEK